MQSQSFDTVLGLPAITLRVRGLATTFTKSKNIFPKITLRTGPNHRIREGHIFFSHNFALRISGREPHSRWSSCSLRNFFSQAFAQKGCVHLFVYLFFSLFQHTSSPMFSTIKCSSSTNLTQQTRTNFTHKINIKDKKYCNGKHKTTMAALLSLHYKKRKKKLRDKRENNLPCKWQGKIATELKIMGI